MNDPSPVTPVPPTNEGVVPNPIIQEWSLDEYMRSAKELDKRLREKLRDDAKVYDRLDDIPMWSELVTISIL